MLNVVVRGIGVLGPGVADWAMATEMLCGRAPWRSAPTPLTSPTLLPPAERRRAGALVKLSLAVAEQAVVHAAADARRLATVFTSSSGDGANCHALCESLSAPERLVSPTRFTNSVHNAAAGYWHIATTSRAASTSLCAFDASFGAGLLEAAMQCSSTGAPVLLVASDVPYPEPLRSLRPMPDAFGMALLLDARDAPGALAHLRLELVQAQPTRCHADGLEALRNAIPAARSLPLLQALATATSADLVLDYLDDLQLAVEVRR